MGFFTGASDALQEALVEQEARRRQEMLDAIAAEDRKARAEDREEGRRIQRETLDGQRADREARTAETKRQTQAKEDAARAEAESEHNRNQLQAAMQGSFNSAGTSDPNGAKATRDALRVALTAGGAKPTEIAQEPAAPKMVEGFTLSPGARRYGADGKLIASAPERAPKPSKPSLPPIYQRADGTMVGLSVDADGNIIEVALPSSLTGKAGTAPKPAKTPEQIEKERYAATAGGINAKRDLAEDDGFGVQKWLQGKTRKMLGVDKQSQAQADAEKRADELLKKYGGGK